MTTVSAARPRAGLPPIERSPPLSFFEYWPGWLFYAPVLVWALLLSLRYRGLRLPMLANPHLPAGGLVGEVKSEVLDQIGEAGRPFVAPYISLTRGSAEPEVAADEALASARAHGLDLPLVAKPELGCRGAGVRPVRNAVALSRYLAHFPTGERFLLQTMADVEGEAGVFFVREPGAARGRILSLTLKYFPYVTGDGVSTVRQLILADPRAGRIAHLYLPRHTHRLSQVLARGEQLRLAFAGSHSRGAIFRNGNAYVTEAMTRRFDDIAASIPEFSFGRFDVRFADFEALRRGEDFTIVECNGAGAESTHIWDGRTSLPEAYGALFRQYALLWRIGAANRRRGFRPESWRTFLARRGHERRATLLYPGTE